MDAQVVINIVIALAGSLGGFVLKAVWDGLRDLRIADAALTSKVQSIEVLVAGSYIKRDDFEKFATTMFGKLERIESKLDMKANKAECPNAYRTP